MKGRVVIGQVPGETVNGYTFYKCQKTSAQDVGLKNP